MVIWPFNIYNLETVTNSLTYVLSLNKTQQFLSNYLFLIKAIGFSLIDRAEIALNQLESVLKIDQNPNERYNGRVFNQTVRLGIRSMFFCF